MVHSRSRAMRSYVASPCVGRVLQKPGYANGATDCNNDGFGNRRRHGGIQSYAD
jgi:hypothetical protein